MPQTPSNSSDLDTLAINTIRTLSMDAVQKANSGHPGTPMALAPVGFHLWQNHLRYDPTERCGPIATALYCRSVMLPCCFIRCCT